MLQERIGLVNLIFRFPIVVCTIRDSVCDLEGGDRDSLNTSGR